MLDHKKGLFLTKYGPNIAFKANSRVLVNKPEATRATIKRFQLYFIDLF